MTDRQTKYDYQFPNITTNPSPATSGRTTVAELVLEVVVMLLVILSIIIWLFV